MDRRNLIRMLVAAGGVASFPRTSRAAGQPLTIRLGREQGSTIAQDFVGLSYERAQLSNPAYFSPRNQELVRLFRGLSRTGNLRLGGSSGEHTRYTGATTPPTPFEIFGPEHTKTVKEGLFVSKAALRSLRGFLDATGWSCLYGLNLAHATIEEATQEAVDVRDILGPRLTAIQIGNEPDAFRNRYRPATWGARDFIEEWDRYHAAIAAAAPGTKFAGPDISNKLEYLTAFAAVARRYPDLIMLTGHYYAMGPAASPEATLDQLREPEPKTTTFKQPGYDVVRKAVAESGLPYRMAEGNSCWDGGKLGVSDVHASAIWGADAMLKFAQQGWIGVNWHGGGHGNYSPIIGTPSKGFSRRPLYYGTQFVQFLSGATFIETIADRGDRYVNHYALRHGNRDRLVVINKRDTPVRVTLPAAPERQIVELTGPSAAAKDATRLDTVSRRLERSVTVPPVTASLFTLPRVSRKRG